MPPSTRGKKEDKKEKTKKNQEVTSDESEDEEDGTEYTNKTIINLIKEVQKSVDYMSNKFEELRGENKEMKKNIQGNTLEITTLKNKIRYLEDSIGRAEKEKIKNNIIITGITSKENTETGVEIVEKIMKGMNIRLSPGAIKNCSKTYTKNQDEIQLCVELTNQEQKLNILKARKTIGSIKTHECDLKGNNKEIYINDQLTPKTMELFYKARQYKKEKNYKFVWTRDGTVYIRKTDTSKKIKITDIEQLD